MRARRGVIALAAAAVAALVTGCGDDQPGVAAYTVAGGQRSATDLTLRTFRDAVERGGVDLKWAQEANTPLVLNDLDPRPVATQGYGTPGSRHINALLFASPAAARAAWDDVVRSDVIEDGGAATRARNLIVVLPRPPRSEGPYRVIWNTVRRLSMDRDATATAGA